MPMPVFNERNELIYVELPEVYAIYKDSNTRKIIVKAECGEYYLPSTIEQIDVIMSASGFLKVNHNEIINLAQVKEVVGVNVYVDGMSFYIAKDKRELIKKYIDNVSRNENS